MGSRFDIPENGSDQMKEEYRQDAERILSHRKDQGWDLWTTSDHRISKGSPFSLLGSLLLLAELGMDPSDPAIITGTDLVFETLRPDGRFQVAPKGAMLPCQTINALNVLCHLGQGEDPRLYSTWTYLLDTRHTDGGWRCLKFSYGRGPETEFSNPGPTLAALDAFRLNPKYDSDPRLDKAVGFLLDHWDTRLPLGPCHYGIGSLFLQVEYPFLTYNLFNYIYVLSHYPKARQDARFLDALQCLSKKLSDGQIIVERVNPKLKDFNFCRKGCPSEAGTRRYQEILNSLK